MGIESHSSPPTNPLPCCSVVYIQPDRMFKFSQRYDWLFPLAAPLLHRKLRADIREMHAFTDKVIRERRANVERARADGSYRPLSGCRSSRSRTQPTNSPPCRSGR